MFLHQEEHRHRRQCGHDAARAHQVIHGAELAVESGDARGHRLAVGALRQYDGPETVVPDEGEDQHRQRRDGGPHQGQHHVPEDASSLIGKEVLVGSDVVALPSEGAVSGQVTLPVSTQAVDVEILAPSGEVLGKVALGPQAAGPVSFRWDGSGLDGERLPAGNYVIRSQYLNGNSVEALQTDIRSPVRSVSLPSGGGSPTVQIDGVGTVSMSQIKEIS